MFRFIDLYLNEWIHDNDRKPLLLRGARQVGKTFAIRKLSKSFSKFIEINFEASPQLKKIFDSEKELKPERIIRDISLALDIEFKIGETLLFLDEIQEVPQAIIALRYFYEEMPNLHVIAAGSLLEFAIEEVGVPVGRVDFLHLYPLSWLEFLKACGHDLILKEILKHNIHEPESEIVHNKILDLLKIYLAIGGMPKVVSSWVEKKDPKACAKIHHSILNTYRQDFHKFAKENQIKYLELLFDGAVRQLGKKFKFSNIGSEFRKRELNPALSLLEKANIVHRICHSSGQGIPMGAEANPDKYKVIFLDIGLSQALLGLDLADWFLDSNASFINKGAIVEAFVGQELLAYSDPYQKAALYYWQREIVGSESEVDYLAQLKGKVIPIEVKSQKGKSLKSMQIFLESHPQSPFGIRFSTHNYSSYNNIHSYPLYAIPLGIMWKVPGDI